MNGFIYIMSNPSFSDNRIKIGKSKSDPSSFRKDELYSTGVPEPFQVEYFAFVENYDSVELQIHKKLDDKRPNKDREFFTSTIPEAIITIREIAKIKYEEVFYKSLEPPTGIVEKFHSNGQLKSRGNYKDGIENGIWESFHENGQLESRGNYNNYGGETGIWEQFHSNGQLKWRGNYKDGVQTGITESFHENGQLKWSGKYDEFGYEIGLWECFYPNGQSRFREHHDGLNRVAYLMELFYENGQLEWRFNRANSLIEYFEKDGILIKTEMWDGKDFPNVPESEMKI